MYAVSCLNTVRFAPEVFATIRQTTVALQVPLLKHVTPEVVSFALFVQPTIAAIPGYDEHGLLCAAGLHGELGRGHVPGPGEGAQPNFTCQHVECKKARRAILVNQKPRRI